jgi:hypothetical protein
LQFVPCHAPAYFLPFPKIPTEVSYNVKRPEQRITLADSSETLEQKLKQTNAEAVAYRKEIVQRIRNRIGARRGDESPAAKLICENLLEPVQKEIGLG